MSVCSCRRGAHTFAALCGAATGLPAGAAFRYGWLAGVVQYLVALRWLLHIPFPAGAVAGWLALSAYCAVYPGLWIWLCLRVLRLPGPLACKFRLTGAVHVSPALMHGQLSVRAPVCVVSETWLEPL